MGHRIDGARHRINLVPQKTSLVGFWTAPNWFGVITIVIIGLCISENSTVGLKRLVPIFDLWKLED